MYCIEKSTCDIVATYRGIVPLLTPRYPPGCVCDLKRYERWSFVYVETVHALHSGKNYQITMM